MESGRLPTSRLLASNNGRHKGGIVRSLALLSIVTAVALSGTGFLMNGNGVLLLVSSIPILNFLLFLIKCTILGQGPPANSHLSDLDFSSAPSVVKKMLLSR